MITAPETGAPALQPDPSWLAWLGLGLAAVALVYTIAAWLGVLLRPRRSAWPAPVQALPAVTILKPLCGAEPRLYECLRTFCSQSWPRLQIVFGVRDASDPAVAVVRRLQREFPALDLALAVNATHRGSNNKVGNLINMMPLAAHDHLVIADSDISVPEDYLRLLIPPLLDERVGIVTCAYVGRPLPDRWSQLGALFINGWFMPSVFVAALFGSRAFAFGATIALRRKVLEAIGGFEAIADQLADDYRLGELTRQLGLRTVLSEVVVETCVEEGGPAQLTQHALRWLRTIKAVRPLGYSMAFVTFGVPLALLGTLLAQLRAEAGMLLGFTVMARLMLHFCWRPRGDRSAWSDLWAVPLHDVGAFALWCWGFLGQRVHWRQTSFHVARDGSAYPMRRRLDDPLMRPPLEHE